MEEKKESWIEKLIELLNKFLYPSNWYIQYHNWNEFKRTPTKSAVEWDKMLQNEYICSKKFWFIKWLVDNDKIDTSKANDKNLNGYEIELRIRAVKELVADSEEKTVLYLNLLMLLAIEDEPIDFLISILR